MLNTPSTLPICLVPSSEGYITTVNLKREQESEGIRAGARGQGDNLRQRRTKRLNSAQFVSNVSIAPATWDFRPGRLMSLEESPHGWLTQGRTSHSHTDMSYHRRPLEMCNKLCGRRSTGVHSDTKLQMQSKIALQRQIDSDTERRRSNLMAVLSTGQSPLTAGLSAESL